MKGNGNAEAADKARTKNVFVGSSIFALKSDVRSSRLSLGPRSNENLSENSLCETYLMSIPFSIAIILNRLAQGKKDSQRCSQPRHLQQGYPSAVFLALLPYTRAFEACVNVGSLMVVDISHPVSPYLIWWKSKSSLVAPRTS